MKRTILAGLLLAALVCPGVPAAAQTSGPVVHIKNFAFVPATLTVKAGTTVTFVNDDQDAHTATSVDKAFDSAGMDTSDTWKHEFDRPGTYAYFCAVHPYMKGVIKVSAP